MRSVVWSLMTVAALALAGCNSSNSSQQPTSDAATPAAAAPTTVSGSISLRDPNAHPSSADKLEINLVDISAQGSAPLATKTIAPATTFPQTFELSFNPSDVVPNDLYIVQVVLTDGDRHYTMTLQQPVLTKGNKSQGLQIQLAAEQTAGEKMLVAFTAVQSQIGGMKVKSGTRLEKGTSRGWQIFRDGGEVKFIRELVDNGDKGFTSTDYAYRDGKPWVVVQQSKPSPTGKTTATDRAGWSDDGSLVLKQHDVGGNVTTLSDSDAANLQQQSKAILDLATGGKNK